MSQPPPEESPESSGDDLRPVPETGPASEAEKSADLAPAPARKGARMSAGAWWGCGGMTAAGVVGLLLSSLASDVSSVILIFVIPAVVVTLAGVALLIPKKTRRFGLGFSLVATATWIVIIGPCVIGVSTMQL